MNITAPYRLRRLDNRGARFYYERINGAIKKYIGITSLGQKCVPPGRELITWQLQKDPDGVLLERAAEFGTLMHLCIDAYDNGKPWRDLIPKGYPYVRAIEGSVLAWKKFCLDYDVQVLGSEVMLRYEEGLSKFANTLDKIAYIVEKVKTKVEIDTGVLLKSGKNKGKPKMKTEVQIKEVKHLAIIDLKSNFFDKPSKDFYEAHQFQLWGQAMSLMQTFPQVKAVRMFNWAPRSWRARTSGLENLYTFYEWKDDYAQEFRHKLIEAERKGWMIPYGKVEVFSDFSQETPLEEAYKVLDYDQFVELCEAEEAKEEEATTEPLETIE